MKRYAAIGPGWPPVNPTPRAPAAVGESCQVFSVFKVRMVWLLVFLGFGLGNADAREPACAPAASEDACGRFEGGRALRRPQRVLIVPLLHKEADSIESERWPENPAASMERFYRNAYGARVTWLRNVRTWEDYYQQAGLLLQRSLSYDRVILVGHGGFDGPILDAAVFRKNLEVDAGTGKLSRAIESQPGLQESLTITYDANRNAAFSDYIADHWQELLKLDADPVKDLETLEARLQPLNRACAEHCMSDPATRGGDRVAACEWICRDPLFNATSGEEVAPERFSLFAGSLRKLVAEDGLIVIGACNPGTFAEGGERPWERDGLLVHSTLAGGPYPSYVHLLAAATHRAVAGPIGKISADQMTAFIAMLENNRGQRQLRLVVPAAGATAP